MAFLFLVMLVGSSAVSSWLVQADSAPTMQLDSAGVPDHASQCEGEGADLRGTLPSPGALHDVLSMLQISSTASKRTFVGKRADCQERAPGNSCDNVEELMKDPRSHLWGDDQCNNYYEVHGIELLHGGFTDRVTVMCHNKRMRSGCRNKGSGIGFGLLGGKTLCPTALSLPNKVQTSCDEWKTKLEVHRYPFISMNEEETKQVVQWDVSEYYRPSIASVVSQAIQNEWSASYVPKLITMLKDAAKKCKFAADAKQTCCTAEAWEMPELGEWCNSLGDALSGVEADIEGFEAKSSSQEWRLYQWQEACNGGAE